MRADHITKNDLLAYQTHRKHQGAASKTINNELQMVMKALRMGSIQLPELKMLKTPPAREGFFDDQKIDAVTRHLPEYLRAPFMFAYYTGWRREEVFSLRWTAVDFPAGEVRLFDSKSGEHRAFPMGVVPKLRELLQFPEAQRQAWQADGYDVPWVFARYVEETRTVR